MYASAACYCPCCCFSFCVVVSACLFLFVIRCCLFRYAYCLLPLFVFPCSSCLVVDVFASLLALFCCGLLYMLILFLAYRCWCFCLLLLPSRVVLVLVGGWFCCVFALYSVCVVVRRCLLCCFFLLRSVFDRVCFSSFL